MNFRRKINVKIIILSNIILSSIYFHFLLIYITTDNDQCLTIGRKDVRKLKISKAKILDIGKSFGNWEETALNGREEG